MKNLVILFVALTLCGKSFPQSCVCFEDLTVSQNNGTFGIYFTPVVVTIKNAVGADVKVPVMGPASPTEPGVVMSAPVVSTGPAGAAGNCFSYALYTGQGGPYHGNYKFFAGGYLAPYKVLDNCAVVYQNGLTDELSKLLDGFDYVNSTYENVAGTVIFYYNQTKKYYEHAAISMGNGMVRQISWNDGPYEEVSLSSVNSTYPNDTKTYYRLKQPYASNPNAGLVQSCTNIYQCTNTVAAPTISGPSNICNHTMGTFTANTHGVNYYAYQWVLESGTGITVSNGNKTTASVSASYNFPAGGIFQDKITTWIQFKYKYSACSEWITLDKYYFTVENTDYPIVISPAIPCRNGTATITLPDYYVHASNWTWEVGGPGYVITSGQGTSSINIRTGLDHGAVWLTFINHCGQLGMGRAIMVQ